MARPKILMLKGLPASGKSTFAKEMVENCRTKNRKWVRVNKDDLRSMLHNSHFTKGNEKQVLAMRDAIVEDSLTRGMSIIVDDTNLAPKHAMQLSAIAKKHNAGFGVQTFDTPVEECITRDLKRPNSVGERVIRDMYEQFLAPKVEPYPHDESLESAVIFDLDGTLAHMVDRGPYDWKSVGSDSVDTSVRTILLSMVKTHKVVVLSGRDAVCREETEKWLYDNKIPYAELHMRSEGDMRKDSTVKWELFEEHIKNKYNVLCIFDDRQQVVDMWRSHGLPCYQVAKGDF